MSAVPLVDLAPWYSGGPAGRRQVATDVDRALCEAGFLLLTGHRVDACLADQVRAEARRLFALPPARKARLSRVPGGRGWVPPGCRRPARTARSARRTCGSPSPSAPTSRHRR
ncbi:2-oxoglutarate and iron-dependent oxygenase domain-containing protein [Modestobacter marinus]|uniref:2-oxoglutarate and iron-dependent oxygenase domain-containing protein n=1 Tax=Modestobacter italicus (strain DSM 44449 / CECT 9708 / BC 501) TaxID=2732864 RepID=UPI0002F4DDE7